MPWFLTLWKIMLKCFVFFELSSTRIDWQSYLWEHHWGHPSREVVRPLKGLPEAITPLPTFVIFSLYWCHRPLISSSPWAWNGQSSPAFPFFHCKETAHTFFFLPLVISLQKHHYWIEYTLHGWKRSMRLNVQSCLSWTIPSHVHSHSWSHSTGRAHAPGLWTVLCLCFGMERCMYFS